MELMWCNGLTSRVYNGNEQSQWIKKHLRRVDLYDNLERPMQDDKMLKVC